MGAFRLERPKQQAAIPQAPTGKRTDKRGEADRFCPVDRKTAQKCYGLARACFPLPSADHKTPPSPAVERRFPRRWGHFLLQRRCQTFPSFCILPPGAAVRHGRR